MSIYESQSVRLGSIGRVGRVEMAKRALALTPAQLEHYLRNKVSPEIIATTHGVSIADVHSLAVRWGLDHLSGRIKTTVTINKGA